MIRSKWILFFISSFFLPLIRRRWKMLGMYSVSLFHATGLQQWSEDSSLTVGFLDVGKNCKIGWKKKVSSADLFLQLPRK